MIFSFCFVSSIYSNFNFLNDLSLIQTSPNPFYGQTKSKFLIFENKINI